MDMENYYYIFLTISRQLRLIYFFVIMIKFYELGDGEVEKQMRMISITLLLMIFVTSGIFVEIENSQAVVGINLVDCVPKDVIDPKTGLSTKSTSHCLKNGTFIYKPDATWLDFHSGLYFVVVTITTVGYGDINANYALSKVCTMMLIVLTVAIVPSQTTELLNLIQKYSIYKKMEYNAADLKHVVVSGHISFMPIVNFCAEMFHDDHGDNQVNTVIVQNVDPKPDLVAFMESYEKSMFYLSADPLNCKDMIERAKTHKADACILLTNKNSPNSSEEDYRNILIALAVKKFVYDQKKDQGEQKDIPLCMQLIKPESKDLYYKSLNLSPLQD